MHDIPGKSNQIGERETRDEAEAEVEVEELEKSGHFYAFLIFPAGNDS